MSHNIFCRLPINLIVNLRNEILQGVNKLLLDVTCHIPVRCESFQVKIDAN